MLNRQIKTMIAINCGPTKRSELKKIFANAIRTYEHNKKLALKGKTEKV